MAGSGRGVGATRGRIERAAERLAAGARLRRDRPGDQAAALPARGRARRPEGGGGGGEGRARLPARSTSERHPRPRRRSTSCSTGTSSWSTLERSTLATYQGYIDKHIRPLIGRRAGRRARRATSSTRSTPSCGAAGEHCDGRAVRRPPDAGEHECDDRCRPHVCRPLGASTIRQIHFILSGALKRAVRWRWIATNPGTIGRAAAGAASRTRRRPAEAARILAEAWMDPDGARSCGWRW